MFTNQGSEATLLWPTEDLRMSDNSCLHFFLFSSFFQRSQSGTPGLLDPITMNVFSFTNIFQKNIMVSFIHILELRIYDLWRLMVDTNSIMADK